MDAYLTCYNSVKHGQSNRFRWLFFYIFGAFPPLHGQNWTGFDSNDWLSFGQLFADDSYYGGSWPNSIGGISPSGIIPGLNLPGRRCQDGRDQDGFRQVSRYRNNHFIYSGSIGHDNSSCCWPGNKSAIFFLYHPAFFWKWFEYSDCFADASPADLRQTLPGSFFSAAVRARVHERPRLSLSIVQLLVKREIIQSPEKLTSFNNSIAFFFFLCYSSRLPFYSNAVGGERENCELSDRSTRELDQNNPSYFETNGDYDFYERSLNSDCLDGNLRGQPWRRLSNSESIIK